MMLGVRIFYRYSAHEPVRVRHGYRMQAAPGHGVVRLPEGEIADVTADGLMRRLTCENWLDVPYTGEDLDDYLRRFNDRDPALFDGGRGGWYGRDLQDRDPQTLAAEWLARVAHCSTVPPDHRAYNAYFVHDGQKIQGLDDAETLRTTPRERQVQAALRDRLHAVRPDDISNREYAA